LRLNRPVREALLVVAFLQVIKGSRPGQVLELRSERMVLGRHPSCEIVLDNAAVSRQHAQIVNRRGTFFLEDLRSRNRTYLNGTAIDARTPLNDADEVTICDIVLQFFHSHKEESTNESAPGRPAGAALRDDPRQTRAIETLPAGDQSEEALEESSSIITTMDAKSAPTMRLGVKPEVKLRAIMEMSNTLARTLKVDDVLQSLLDGCFKVFPQADSGFVMLAGGEDRESIVKAALARGGDATGSVRMSNTILRTAMESGEAILSADALEDSRFDASESLDGLGIRSMICVPLMAKGGTALGAIQLQTQSLRHQFTQSDLDVLISVGSQAILAVENARLHEDLLRRSDIERELRFATQVQLGFLPEIRPNPPGYEFFDYYEPAQRVGGDYFDYIQLNDGRIAICLADVAGKGIPAALLMARLYSSVRLHVFSQPTLCKALSALNAEVHAQGMGHRFVTFVLLTLDPLKHEMTIVNAGHLPPIVRTLDGETTSVGRKESGMPLGVNPEHEYRELTMTLEPGMSVVVYTDGITESMNAANELFGRVRLEKFVSSISDSAEELTKAIVTEVDRFCGTRPQRDDMCLVCLRRLDQPGLRDDSTCPSIPIVSHEEAQHPNDQGMSK
jgi:serine phosphatase RsbU (regulator of sigma subunit)/pSer/pThr/pTyr-binding forkhead associated (FHA) protein